MTYKFRDDVLAAIAARKQNKRTHGSVEDVWERTTLKRILSKHNGDLALLSGVYIAIFIAVLISVAIIYFADPTIPPSADLAVAQSADLHQRNFNDTNDGFKILLGSAVLGALIGLIGRTYDIALKRLSTVDLFVSEMLSIGRVFVAANIIGAFIRLYDKVDAAGKQIFLQDKEGTDTLLRGARPSGFADAARRENYFSIFEKNCQDLGTLNPAVVDDVTAFYTFLKAARDATGSMSLWKEPHYDAGMMKSDIVNVIYLCFLMTIHGKLALEQLIESDRNRRIAKGIFAGVELQCYAFLNHVLREDDFRRHYVVERAEACMQLFDTYRYEFRPQEGTKRRSSAVAARDRNAALPDRCICRAEGTDSAVAQRLCQRQFDRLFGSPRCPAFLNFATVAAAGPRGGG